MINYFDILNVSENAEKEVINSAYKALAKKYHPDSTKLSKDIAAERMTILNEAYRILSDDEAKQEYIRMLHEKDMQSEEKRNGKRNGKRNEGEDAVSNGNQNAVYASRSKERESIENESVIVYVVWAIIIISVICCVVYFGPEIWDRIWNNIRNGVEDIINTF